MFTMKLNISLKIFSFLLIFLTTIAAQARTADLKDPAPIPIPEGISLEQAQTATKGATLQKGWTINKVVTESPRIEEIEYRIKAHSMTLTAEYSAESITLRYQRSENLNYKSTKKGPKIHPNYNVWAQQLASQIASNLAMGNSFKLDGIATKGTTNPPPKEAFSNFDQIEFEPVSIDSSLPKKKPFIRTGENLQHNTKIAASTKIDQWTKPNPKRTLIVQTKITGLKFVGGGTRFMVGAMAGRSWISVQLTFIDKSNNEIINQASLYRVADMANGFTLARADYAMVEQMGRDIVNYIENNYKTALGGGTVPPTDK